MSQTSTSTTSSSASSVDGDGTSIDLGASLLLSTRKYKKIWRKSYYIGLFISFIKSTTTSSESPPLSPTSSVPYTTLPPSSVPPAAPGRTSSNKSYVGIEIVLDAEEEEEEEVEDRILSDVARIAREQDSEALLKLGGVDGVCSILSQRGQDFKGTISSGSHRVSPVHRTSFCSLLCNSCKRNGYTILMLLISAGLSFATEFKQEGPRHGWHDGVAILIAIMLMVAFPSISNFWRERTMMKLSKRKEKLKFEVERGEEKSQVAFSDIVVGDIVYLRKGAVVPADGLFLGGDKFLLAETRSESDRERNPFLFAGSKVNEGYGRMVVTSLGNRTMHSSMSCCDPERRSGLLERRIEKPISYFENFALLISVVVAFAVLIRLVCKKNGDSGGLPDIKGNISIKLLMETLQRIFFTPQGRISILAGLVTVAILCIQHGMPLAVTISLYYKIDKVVSNHNAILNDLSACTTMGLVTVICIDVSGGLVSKSIEVSRVWMGEKDIDMVEGSEADQVVREALREGVSLSVLAQELPLSPISNSLISWAETPWGLNKRSFAEEFDIIQRGDLNSGKDGNKVLVRKVGDSEQVLHLHWSGAASTVLDMCSLYYDCKGERRAMKHQRIEFKRVIKEMEDSGLEPIAFAHKQTEAQELEQDELILLGMIGLKHTCQESTKSTLQDLREAGIEIKLVSKDDIMVVKDIACKLGLDGVVLEGKELQDLSDSAKSDKVDVALIMGSFSSEDMLLMVQCLQKNGHVVAFTTMTTSHALVLQVADVGIIVHDTQDTIEDKQSYGITLKCFSALKPIVSAGRSNYNNIKKFIQIQLIFGISGSFITLITTISTGESPLTAIQLIWVNVLMCHLGSIMMIMKLYNEEHLADIQPYTRNKPIVTKEIWKNIIIQVLYQTSASMILEFGGHVTDIEKEVRKTMIFNMFLLCQVFNLLNTMQLLKREVLEIVLQSYYFLVALAFSFGMQFLVIEYAKGLANCMKLNGHHWAMCVLIGVLPFAFECALKILAMILSRTNNTSESNTSSSVRFTSQLGISISNSPYLPWIDHI